MSERVWMVHKDLPGQPIRVRPASVGVYQASGWQVVDSADAPAVQQPAQIEHAQRVLTAAGWTLTPPQPDGEQPAETTSEPRRRRRTEPSEGDN